MGLGFRVSGLGFGFSEAPDTPKGFRVLLPSSLNPAGPRHCQGTSVLVDQVDSHPN